MKIIVGLLILLLMFSCQRHPKDTLTLNIIYKPDNTYLYTTEQTLHTIIKYTGKEKTLQALKSRNILNPTIINKISNASAIIKTGKLEEDNRFSVKVEYLSATSNDNRKESTIKATFHGKCMWDSIPVFDVAVGEDLDIDSKNYILDSWNKSFSQLSFSGEKLKIGQEVVNQSLQSIPMEGSEIKMVVSSSYKLIEIKEDIAYFDIIQQYTLNPKLLDNSFDGKVNGKGQMVYDMDNSIILNYTLETEMQLTKKLDSFEFHLKTNSTFKQTNKLVNN